MVDGILEFIPYDSDIAYFKKANNTAHDLLKIGDIIVYEKVTEIVRKIEG